LPWRFLRGLGGGLNTGTGLAIGFARRREEKKIAKPQIFTRDALHIFRMNSLRALASFALFA
jgi:hypothetical protein